MKSFTRSLRNLQSRQALRPIVLMSAHGINVSDHGRKIRPLCFWLTSRVKEKVSSG